MRPFVLAVSAVTMAALAAGAPASQAPADDLFERARAINRASPLVDGHNDYAWAVREDVPTLDLAAIDIRGAQPKTMTDIPRLRAGGVGGQFWSVGLEDVSRYPALTAELLGRGYSEDDLRKVLGQNMLRVMRETERVSAVLQKERPPSSATIEGLDGKR